MVEVVDLIGTTDVNAVIAAAGACAARQLSPARPFISVSFLTPIVGHLPSRLIPDPAGYFVIYVDRSRHRLSLEHYRNDGLLDTLIEGATAAEVYTPAVDRGLLSRLDHAAYLGRELARAEHALRTDEPYIQDGAPTDAASHSTAEPTPTSCCGTSDGSRQTCSSSSPVTSTTM